MIDELRSAQFGAQLEVGLLIPIAREHFSMHETRAMQERSLLPECFVSQPIQEILPKKGELIAPHLRQQYLATLPEEEAESRQSHGRSYSQSHWLFECFQASPNVLLEKPRSPQRLDCMPYPVS